MRRRVHHKKSKNGCLECKRRHMKCDERRPSCVNCTTSQRVCTFIGVENNSPKQLTASPVSSPATSYGSNLSFVDSPATIPVSPRSVISSVTPVRQSPAPLEYHRQPGFAPVSPAINDSTNEETASRPGTPNSDVNMLHLELFYHILNDTSMCFGASRSHAKSLSELVIPPALTHPFLMNELLAVSALHLSTLHTARRQQLQNAAEELQTNALSLFNQSCQEITANNCIPVFMFSSLLGNHVFFTTFTSHSNNFHAFLEEFVRYMQLHRGVRSLISNNWEYLRGIPAKALMLDDDSQLPSDEAQGDECDSLRHLLFEADLGPAAKSTYVEAVNKLQWAFDAQRVRSMVGLTFSWPIRNSAEYLDLLKQRRPEALAILAYFGVLLHSHRKVWLVGGAGRYLIESISGYLGTYWENWLAWPNAALNAPSTPENSMES